MNSLFLLILVATLFSSSSIQYSPILPPQPDLAPKLNTSTAPLNCKLLSSDHGWPAEHIWKSAFPGIFKKLKGTDQTGSFWIVQAKTVEDVQNAVNFARDNNVRLSIISSGSDFHGRQTARSGLRIDLASLREPTVFSKDWNCGDELRPETASRRPIREVQACTTLTAYREPGTTIDRRSHEVKFFEKRNGIHCGNYTLYEQKKSDQGSKNLTVAGLLPGEVAPFNVIKPHFGKHAYARVSAGITNQVFYSKADKSGLMTIGGHHMGVSVTGGGMQAGGHSPFSHKFGTQADSVVEIEVVTADGRFQKVSQCRNSELFWALRGGGGSTFGVVTGATVKVYLTFPIVVTRFFVNSTSKAGIMKATAYFLQEGAKLRDKHGLQGHFFVYPGAFQSALCLPDAFATLENAKAVTEPLMRKLEEFAGAATHIEPNYYQYKTYKHWFDAEFGNEDMDARGEQFLSWNDGSDGSVPSQAQVMRNPLSIVPYELAFPHYPARSQRVFDTRFMKSKMKRSPANSLTNNGTAIQIMRSQPLPRHYLDSRLLSDEHVNSVSTDKLAHAINLTMPAIPRIHVRGLLSSGRKELEKDNMGLLPAWRDMTWHFITNAVPGNIRHDYGIDSIARLFPEAGAYVNEASPDSPNWKHAYWGAHYPRLEFLKQKYDPTNVFWCSPCVGADMLTYDDERICSDPLYTPSYLTTLSTSVKPPPATYPNQHSKIGISSVDSDPGIPDPMLPIIT